MDGRLDVATAIQGNLTKVMWLKNEGNLTFSDRFLAALCCTSIYFRWIETTDLDADGDPDLVASSWDRNVQRYSIFLNDGSGLFTESRLLFPYSDGSMWTFSIWPDYQDGRPAIFPGVWSGHPLPLLAPVPNTSLTTVRRPKGALELSWTSRSGYDYDFEFSQDLETWEESYLSSRGVINPDVVASTGAEIKHLLPPPGGSQLYVRVIWIQAPLE